MIIVGVLMALALFVFGFLMLAGGAVGHAKVLGVDERLSGPTVVEVWTSIPRSFGRRTPRSSKERGRHLTAWKGLRYKHIMSGYTIISCNIKICLRDGHPQTNLRSYNWRLWHGTFHLRLLDGVDVCVHAVAS